MARKVKVQMKAKGSKAVLKSAGVKKILNKKAAELRDKAGPGFAVGPADDGPNRSSAAVYTAGRQGMVREARDRALTTALGQMRNR